jgi:hypothetical protein
LKFLPLNAPNAEAISRRPRSLPRCLTKFFLPRRRDEMVIGRRLTLGQVVRLSHDAPVVTWSGERRNSGNIVELVSGTDSEI